MPGKNTDREAPPNHNTQSQIWNTNAENSPANRNLITDKLNTWRKGTNRAKLANNRTSNVTNRTVCLTMT